MAKGYWVARVDVYDMDSYKQYATLNQIAFKKYGAKYLVRGGAFELHDGMSRARNVVIEFPSYQAAKDCYNSPEYKEASKHRGGRVSAGDIIIIEGYDGPQPA